MPVIVLVASRRNAPLFTPPAGLAQAHGIRVLDDRVPAAHLLPPALQQRRPDVVLLDEAMLGDLSARVLAQMQTHCPGLRVLVVGDEIRLGLAEAVLRHGFHGLLPAVAPPEACLKAVWAVSRGELWLPRALLGWAVSRFVQGTASDDAEARRHSAADGLLTGREAQIVGFLRQGLTNKEIARRLGIMEDTVKKHLQGVFGKLGVRRRALVALHRAPPRLHDA